MIALYIKNHGGLEAVEVGDLNEPRCGPKEVVVKVHFAALNHLDIWVRGGLDNLKVKFPHILCSDASGVVESVGESVKSVKPGDEVIVHPGISCGRCNHCLTGEESLCRSYGILGESQSGTAAQFICVPEGNVFIKPKRLTLAEAASVALVFTTAWQMVVRKAKIQPGDLVLIHAAGSGVSSAAIQIAKLFSANVIATAGSPSKLEMAKKLGADLTVNYSTEDFLKVVKEKTDRLGVDVILDHTGEANWEKNIRALRHGGKLVFCGATSGYDVSLDLRRAFFHQHELMGSTMGSKGDFPKILTLLQSESLNPVIDRIFPLAEASLAYKRLESREQFGKVLLEMPL